MGKIGNLKYDLVEEKSIIILKEKSKDIRVISFLSFVYLRKEKWESFTEVFKALTQLCEESYDQLFPARPRQKQLAFKWLSEQRYVGILETKKPEISAFLAIQTLNTTLSALKKTLESKFPEGSPFPSRLFSISQQWEKSLKSKVGTEKKTTSQSPEQPAPQAPSQTPSQENKSNVEKSSSPATPHSVSSSSVSSKNFTQAPIGNTKDAQTEARKIALFLIEKEPEKPMGYRLIRSLRWDSLVKIPPANNAITMLAPPSPEKRTYLKNLIAKGDWKKALTVSEVEFASRTSHFWLDLQRMSADACKELGDNYTLVCQAICQETALFLKRFPEIVQYVYSDQTPFCDNVTRDWINSEVKSILSSSEQSNQTNSQGTNDPIEGEKKEINKLIAAGKETQAIELLQENMKGSGNESMNFKRSLIICDLLFSIKRADIALAILESLNEKINTFHLDKWDPLIAIEVWRLLIKSYKIVSDSKSPDIQTALLQKQNSILNKLSCLDPTSSLKIKI